LPHSIIVKGYQLQTTISRETNKTWKEGEKKRETEDWCAYTWSIHFDRKGEKRAMVGRHKEREIEREVLSSWPFSLSPSSLSFSVPHLLKHTYNGLPFVKHRPWIKKSKSRKKINKINTLMGNELEREREREREKGREKEQYKRVGEMWRHWKWEMRRLKSHFDHI
jgi:hypothetical protein